MLRPHPHLQFFQTKPLKHATTSAPLGFALLAEQLRTLIVVYYQSLLFIGPEKLDKAIDCAFADVANMYMVGASSMAGHVSLREKMR